MKSVSKPTGNPKLRQIQAFRAPDAGDLTTNQGLPYENDRETLRAGLRGPQLLQDFIVREKLTHFDHERIPERIVHARGTGAYGYFQPYRDHSDLTRAAFLRNPEQKTPVFVRFSTVAGFRGSPDTVRDLRGFAVKFYTEEGNYDIVGNNVPVFFVQDAAKFPDLIHAVKPEPQDEMPQASSAHDSFWHFVTLNPESTHTLFWLMSDRALPRSYRMMEGFGVHTFRMINEKGEIRFVKFHFKPLLGVHSLLWEEAQSLAGKDPDFNRRDLVESIRKGNFPEWEFCVQVLDPADEFRFDFDLLDSTKLWPEELIPLRKLGKLVLNRNVTDFHAETEQAAFCPANLVPGIDLSEDPLLQGRLFSYLDTQLSRLGGPNFHEIPVNRPLAPVRNNQRGGIHRMTVDSRPSYHADDSDLLRTDRQAPGARFEFCHSPVRGTVTRERPEGFFDYYTQASMFYNSLSAPEKRHLRNAFVFELGKCVNPDVRRNAVELLNRVDGALAVSVATGIGALPPAKPSMPASNKVYSSLATSPDGTLETRKFALLLAEGYDAEALRNVTAALRKAGAETELISDRLGIPGTETLAPEILKTFSTTDAACYDGAVVLGGTSCAATLSECPDALRFLNDVWRQCKPIGATEGAEAVLLCTDLAAKGIAPGNPPLAGVVLRMGSSQKFCREYLKAAQTGRFFERECQKSPVC